MSVVAMSKPDAKKFTLTPGDPPLIAAARLVCHFHQYRHVDDVTGRLVADGAVEAALRDLGLSLDYTEAEVASDDVVLVCKKRGKDVNPILLDGTTASMIVQVYDTVTAPDKAAVIRKGVAKFGVCRFVDKLWKIATKSQKV